MNMNSQSTASLLVQDLRCEYQDNPLGIDVVSHQSIHVPYGGSALHSGQRCTWRVRAWDGNDQPSAWSEPAWWEMGLLHPADWQAHWVEPGWQEDPNTQHPCPYLRATFSIDG